MPCCRTSRASSSRSVPLLCLIALAVRAEARERPEGFTAGRQRCCGYRRRRILGEFPGAARSDASHRLQLGNCMGFPCHHRHRGGSVHPDAGCARGQTSTAYPHCGCTGIRPCQSQCVYRTRTCFRTSQTALSACGSGRIECRSAPVDPALRAASAPVACGMRGRTTPYSHRLWSMRARPRSPRQWSRRSSAHARGTALNRIASDIGIHHKTVLRRRR